MPTEHEAKILDIDPIQFEGRILDEGGQKVRTSLQRRYVYAVSPGEESTWLRLHDNGHHVTLSLDENRSGTGHGVTTSEVVVSDFSRTHTILGNLGYRSQTYQENQRTRFELDGAEVNIVTWPRIPTYAEITAPSKEEVLTTAVQLGYSEDQLSNEQSTVVYERYGIDLATVSDLRFTTEPRIVGPPIPAQVNVAPIAYGIGTHTDTDEQR